MITVIHGDDTANSRKYLSEEKHRLKNFVTFEGEALTITDIAQNIEGKGLFAEKTAIIIENFLSKKSKLGRDTKQIIDFLKKHFDADVIFWEGKEISKKSVEVFPRVINKLFKFPQKLFFFLDSIRPNNSKYLINLFHETLENAEVELIFFMLIRQFRLLLGLSDTNSKENTDEALRLAPWQRGKLINQARLFTTDELKKIYGKLGEIDLGQKTGSLNLSLTQSIDFFLLEI